MSAKHLKIAVIPHPEGGIQHGMIHDFSSDTLRGLEGPKVDTFKKWSETGYHPDMMPIGVNGLTEGHLHAARALYTHLDPLAVEMHVKNPKGFDPLGVNEKK